MKRNELSLAKQTLQRPCLARRDASRCCARPDADSAGRCHVCSCTPRGGSLLDTHGPVAELLAPVLDVAQVVVQPETECRARCQPQPWRRPREQT
eukprot:1998347-Rhodomonas_salina.1